MEGDLPQPQERIVHYYGSEEEVEEDHVEDELLPNIESPIVALRNLNHIIQFLKLPKGSKKPIRMERAKFLVDYSKFQLLITNEHI